MIILLIFIIFISLYELKLIQDQKKLLNRYENIRKKLYETGKIISKTNHEDKIYSIVLDTIIELIPNATNGSVLLYDNKVDRFFYKVVKGYQNDLENFTFKKEETFLYQINKFKETVIIKNPLEFDKKNVHKDTVDGLQEINALDISCTLSAPIYIDNRIIGLINVDSIIPGHVFTDKDLNLMDQIKCELELAINNALAQNKLKYLANYDELTGLVNRRFLKKEVEKELEKIKHNKKQMSVVMIDLDDFKNINDTYGHYFGDMALKHFSSMLMKLVGKDDMVARLAGDEFIILLKEYDLASAERKMISINEAIANEKFEGIVLDFSYGIYNVKHEDNINFDMILSYADDKMYENKKVKI